MSVKWDEVVSEPRGEVEVASASLPLLPTTPLERDHPLYGEWLNVAALPPCEFCRNTRQHREIGFDGNCRIYPYACPHCCIPVALPICSRYAHELWMRAGLARLANLIFGPARDYTRRKWRRTNTW